MPGESLALMVFNAVAGAVAYCLIWKEYDPKEVARRVGLAAIAGYIYYWLVQRQLFPDGIMAFVVGYFAVDFLEGFFERWRAYERGKEKA